MECSVCVLDSVIICNAVQVILCDMHNSELAVKGIAAQTFVITPPNDVVFNGVPCTYTTNPNATIG